MVSLPRKQFPFRNNFKGLEMFFGFSGGASVDQRKLGDTLTARWLQIYGKMLEIKHDSYIK